MRTSAITSLVACIFLTAAASSAVAGRDLPERPKPTILTSGSNGGTEFPECIVVPGQKTCPVFSCFTDHDEQISVCKVVGWETTDYPGK